MSPSFDVLTAFLKLVFTAFGRPAAHIGMLRDEFVHRRKFGCASLIDIPTLLIFSLSVIALFRFKVNSTRLIFGGALVGVVVSLLK